MHGPFPLDILYSVKKGVLNAVFHYVYIAAATSHQVSVAHTFCATELLQVAFDGNLDLAFMNK